MKATKRVRYSDPVRAEKSAPAKRGKLRAADVSGVQSIKENPAFDFIGEKQQSRWTTVDLFCGAGSTKEAQAEMR